MSEKIDDSDKENSVADSSFNNEVGREIQRFWNESDYVLKLEDVQKWAQRNPQNSIPTLLSSFWFLKNDKWVYEDFVWKNIIDIGWWFWWLAPTLQTSAKSIIVVDPIFRINDLNSRLDIQINAQEDYLSTRTRYLNEHKDNKNAKYDVDEMQQVFDDLNWWKNGYTKEKYPHIKRNNSFWENIVWVESGSQDYVFLNFVLWKDSVHLWKMLNEVLRVLKKGWKIIVSDYFEIKNAAPLIEDHFKIIRFFEKRIISFVGIKK